MYGKFGGATLFRIYPPSSLKLIAAVIYMFLANQQIFYTFSYTLTLSTQSFVVRKLSTTRRKNRILNLGRLCFETRLHLKSIYFVFQIEQASLQLPQIIYFVSPKVKKAVAYIPDLIKPLISRQCRFLP